MTLTLKTTASAKRVIPLLLDSTQREIRYLTIGLNKTKQHIQEFQRQYHANSPLDAENISPLDQVEWEGELITLEKLQEKITILNSIDFS